MNTHLLNYLLEANLGIVLFFAFYQLLLKNETQFSYRRLYLLAGMVLSLLFPLIKLTDLKTVPSLSEALPVIRIDEPEVTITTTQSSAWSTTDLIISAYLIVCALLALRLIYQLVTVFRLMRVYSDQRVIEIPSSSFLAFSFFNRIFISSSSGLSEKDKEKIVRHEEVHRKKLHSLDILLIEIVRVFFWFNPVLPAYKKEIMMVHEFEADEAAAGDKDTYCELLARAALQSAGYHLGNHFNNSLTLKRIAMIRTMKQNIRKWKVFSTFLFATALFTIISCRDQVMEEIQEASKTTTIAGDFPDHLKPHVERILAENPGVKVIYIEAESLTAEKVKEIEANDILFMNVVKDGNIGDAHRVEMIVRADGTLSKVAGTTVMEGDIYLVVEEPASPQGGMTAFYEAIKQEMKYPAAAVQMNIQGRVFIEFVVEKDGTLSNHRVVKGIGAGCDEEALRALQSINIRWNPGRNKGVPMRTRFVVPITFKLDNTPGNNINRPDTPVPAASQSGEIFMVVEQPATPEGGMKAFYQKLAESIKVTRQATQNRVEGKILIEFVVEPDGTTSNHRIMRGIDAELDRLALEAVKSVNVKWNPGTQRGTPVRSRLIIPITITNGNTVVGMEPPISEGENMKVDFKTRRSADRTIVEGFVFGRDGSPLPNVNVIVEGTTQGTVTKPNGSFRIEFQGNKTLHLSHTGYKSFRIIPH
ncbi:MAG: TonB family protein [Cyclobacteriaceae bacterium]|nr:TonB family protein [Cyclobacteriaceae bacterium]MDW8330881.1 TonB family protein [Cyclobacteriaceae bacterium]